MHYSDSELHYEHITYVGLEAIHSASWWNKRVLLVYFSLSLFIYFFLLHTTIKNINLVCHLRQQNKNSRLPLTVAAVEGAVVVDVGLASQTFLDIRNASSLVTVKASRVTRMCHPEYG